MRKFTEPQWPTPETQDWSVYDLPVIDDKISRPNEEVTAKVDCASIRIK